MLWEEIKNNKDVSCEWRQKTFHCQFIHILQGQGRVGSSKVNKVLLPESWNVASVKALACETFTLCHFIKSKTCILCWEKVFISLRLNSRHAQTNRFKAGILVSEITYIDCCYLWKSSDCKELLFLLKIMYSVSLGAIKVFLCDLGILLLMRDELTNFHSKEPISCMFYSCPSKVNRINAQISLALGL